MKNRLRALFLTISLLFMASCGAPNSSVSSSEPTLESSSSSSLSISSSEATTSFGESSSEEPVEETFHFYCVNDFHGSIVEQMNGRYYESGIAKYFGKLKEYKEADPDHTFILSAGDMFQGSLESNDNFGHLVIEAMNDVGFDAMTLGNHEFDYGQDILLDNLGRMDFPILGANIFKYEGGITKEPWIDAIKASTVVEKSGVKIGFVGAIGYGQTSSITSKYVQDIGFGLPEPVVLEEAKRLREEEGCKAVVYLIHDDMSSCVDYAANKDYFDGVFTGHRHARNNSIVHGVPFVQSYCNGEAISHFALTIKGDAVTCPSYGIINADDDWVEDEEIAAIRDFYIKDPAFAEKADAFAGHVTGTLEAKEGVSNIAARAIYEKYVKQYPDIRGAFHNGMRAPLSGDITYRDIYKAAPFTNRVVIARVTGEDIVKEAGFLCYYRAENEFYEKDEIYTIACIDYCLYHQNDQKEYNYFPSLSEDMENKIILDIMDFPFDILFDFIVNDLNGEVDASDYRNTSPGFGASLAA